MKDIREKYDEWNLSEKAEYWAEILDNIRMGIYDKEEANNKLECIIQFLIDEVQPGL